MFRSMSNVEIVIFPALPYFFFKRSAFRILPVPLSLNCSSIFPSLSLFTTGDVVVVVVQACTSRFSCHLFLALSHHSPLDFLRLRLHPPLSLSRTNLHRNSRENALFGGRRRRRQYEALSLGLQTAQEVGSGWKVSLIEPIDVVRGAEDSSMGESESACEEKTVVVVIVKKFDG